MISPSIFSADALLTELLEWVRIESPTYDAATVNRMLDFIALRIAALGFSVERLPGRDGLGDMLRCRLAGGHGGNSGGILMIAHADSVHPVGTLANALPVRRQGDKCYGPAIYDMKGGTVIALAALKAVLDGNALKLPMTIIVNPDEEIGSPTSRELIEAEGRKAKYVLVTEPARDGGKIVTGRKGVARFEVFLKGVPAHAGTRPQDGRSAIRELGNVIQTLEALNDASRGISVNVGVVRGGTRPNVVAEEAYAEVDMRVPTLTDADELVPKILGLKSRTEGVTVKVTGELNRPPYEKSNAGAALFDHAKELAAGLGFDLVDTSTGGGSDGNFTAAHTATLDGLGVDGEGAHTHYEQMYISSIEPRARLLHRLFQTLR
jgi:glutamate carboxypeptidase